MNKTFTSNGRINTPSTKFVNYSIVTTVKIALVNISLFAGAMATVYYIITNLL